MMGALQLLLAVVCVVSIAEHVYGLNNCKTAAWGNPVFGKIIHLDPEPIPEGVGDYTVHFQLPFGCKPVATLYEVCDSGPFTITIIDTSTIEVHRPHPDTPTSAKMDVQCVPLVPPNQHPHTTIQGHKLPRPYPPKATTNPGHILPVPHPSKATTNPGHILPVPHPSKATTNPGHILPVPHPSKATTNPGHILPIPHPSKAPTSLSHNRPKPEPYIPSVTV